MTDRAPDYQNPKTEEKDAGPPKYERFKSFLRTIWDSKANEALKDNIISHTSNFRASWEEYEEMCDRAIALCTKTQSRPQPLSENQPAFKSAIETRQQEIHERENNSQQGPGVDGHRESKGSNGVDGEETEYSFEEWAGTNLDVDDMLRHVGVSFNV